MTDQPKPEPGPLPLGLGILSDPAEPKESDPAAQ
jgi:hypothetical protein